MAPVKLATIPAGTKLADRGFYLLASPTRGTTINVRSATSFEAGQKIDVDGETRWLATPYRATHTWPPVGS